MIRPKGVSAPRPAPCLALQKCLAVAGTPSWGQVESASGARRVEGGRVGRGGGWSRLSVHRLSSSQGEQDDRSYKQCRTSSPSSTGSVSLGRYTPTSRSPQHYSRPGTCPHPSQRLLPPRACASCCFSSEEAVSYSAQLEKGRTGDGELCF